MHRALDLAWRGWGRVHPNPLVGAVVLQGGRVVGEGYHAEYGGPHAEAVALAAAGEAARGATLVVTLEPCAHQGKQPACADAILRAGVTRVVAAVGDPHPIAQGGAERLRAAGVTVDIGLAADEARAQNASFFRQLAEPSRPFIALKLATSLDARIADREGRSRWISGEQARDYVHWLRAGFDAIGVGGTTARADDPSLTVRGSVTPRVPPRRIIFDRRLELPETLRVVQSARDVPTLLIGGPTAEPARLQRYRKHGVSVAGSHSLRGALEYLRADGVGSLLVEGGGRLAGALLAEGVVDRFHWVQSPLWLGDAGQPAFQGVPAPAIGDAARWRVVERRALGDDTLLVVDRS